MNAKYPINRSRRYEPFIYWWDITPKRKGEIARAGGIRFIQKDSGRYTEIKAKDILPLLTIKRQTSRNRGTSGGNWGIKALASRPNELAVEPGKFGDWAFLPVKWLTRPATGQNFTKRNLLGSDNPIFREREVQKTMSQLRELCAVFKTYYTV